ncbi:Structural maintenance of chromosomes protein 5 [Mycena venus]|uniref:Structural maintenance of chromosomes protein 5 n=1 Tax=Mycena venus TaxID=2733690 RepID=A0A8H6YRC5_9AGAR|nr:Structural maintenance of chromosomes protein 5 [Mycena venus]
MIRGAETSDEGNASPEPATRVEAEKVKSNACSESEEEEMSPRGAKRARANDAGDAVPNSQEEENDEGQEENDGEEEGAAPPPKRVKAKTLPLATPTGAFHAYIPGSIVRIQLRNFVTYDFVEFRPGPYLNMILGPNGTGKSSIACAICIGLNWPPKILGRATELPAFVKLGAESGHIEIELKGPKGVGNLVIRRMLSAKTKSSTFTIGGKSASGAEVTERVARLNVQVGNLCSFLPQDKVSAFAAMSPVELLRETENAAGDERLKTWHATLIEAGAQLEDVTKKVKADTDNMRQLQERNDNIEREVQRYRERKQIERNISLLNVLIPLQHYREVRALYFDLKARQRALHNKVSRLQEKNRPAHALLEQLENEAAELHTARDAAKKNVHAVLAKLTKKTKASEALESQSDDAHTALDNIKRTEKARLANIKNAEAQIAKCKRDLEPKVKLEDEGEVRAERKRVVAEFNTSSHATDKHANDQKRHGLEQRKRRNEQNEAEGRNQLRGLDSTEARKLGNLTHWNRDVGDAVKWLRANKGMFQMEVFEPPALSVSVPDQSFANAVESCFSNAQMQMFVCQCKADYDLLNSSINDNNGLGRKAKVPTWYRPGSENDLAPPPMPPAELEQRGFDGYAIDYVECQEGLKWFLKRELNMHRTAISRHGVQNLQGAIDAVGRPGPNGRSPNTTFIDRETVHQVSRSKYGQRKLMTSATLLSRARNFGGNAQGVYLRLPASMHHNNDELCAVNPVEKKRIDDILQRCKQEAAEIHDEEREIGMEAKRLDKVESEHKAVVAAIDKRIGAIKAEATRQENVKRKMRGFEQTLAAALKKGNEVEASVKLRAEIKRIAKERVKLVSEAVELARDVVTDQMKATQLGLQYIQIGAKKAALKELCDRKDAKYQTALAEFNKIDEHFLKTKAEAKVLGLRSQEVLTEVSEELSEECKKREMARNAYESAVAEAEKNGEAPPQPGEDVDSRSLEELQAELEKQEADLEMNMNTNPGVVEQYEKRKRDIEQLEKTIESRQRLQSKIEKNIKHARDNWEPALQALVASIGKKFSAAFDRIGCAGEIRIREHESYALWAIDILVKFRDTEKLQLLTSQRQSGGERSLTTILYLMSLTEEARAPFSLVDEINQGMDQRAERMVHNSMVEVTCKKDSAQYFLITPKLLPDLEYHERMKVLCVNNGEWLPDESGLGNMMSMIDGFVSKNPGSA